MNPNPLPVIRLLQADAGARREPGRTVVAGVDWTVNAGEFWVVGGDQHAGKTDLLMLAAGLLPPAAGRCELFGREAGDLETSPVTERLRLGFVFEDGRLFPDLTLLQNIALPLQYHRNLSAEGVLQALEPLLDRMELSPLAARRPGELSRNWCKRAGLARALAAEPEVLILDNPLAGLGAAHREWWLRFLDDLARERHLTLILAADDLRPWAGHPQARFALLHEGLFSVAGSWAEFSASRPPALHALFAGTGQNTTAIP
jgi:ABC-type transporter Mla maintaining outer membrane lipid asymmetry ATPase subunit MlaF